MGLIGVGEVLEFLNDRPANLNVILTGRNAPKELIETADLVSEVKDLKHPLLEGVFAKKGIEF